MQRLFKRLVLVSIVTLIPTGSFSGDTPTPNVKSAQTADEDFDRLDGKGTSGKRVDVVEWEGNLELHVYPKGSLAGLALKLDDSNKDRTVMVIGYRFTNNAKKQLIRRAILGVPFTAQFKTFRDAKEPDFDKIVISNNTLSGDLTAYKLDPTPTQLYPDDPTKDKTKDKKVAEKATQPQTSNEKTTPPVVRGTASENADDAGPANPPVGQPPANEEGSIKPFKW